MLLLRCAGGTGIRDGAPVPVLDAVSVQNRDVVDAPGLPSDPDDLWNGFALTTGRFKQIWFPQKDRRVAFDLQTDPLETTDVSAVHADELSKGWEKLVRERARARVGEISAEDADRVRQRLTRLGYLD